LSIVKHITRSGNTPLRGRTPKPLHGFAAVAASVRRLLLESDQISETRALADRVVNYSDALVALMFIGASGLGIAVADPDARASMNLITTWMIGGNIFMGVLVSVLLVVLRRWELDLRNDLPVAVKVRRYSRYFYWARHFVVWLAVAQVTAILLLSSMGG
jgi:hypothetical protein